MSNYDHDGRLNVQVRIPDLIRDGDERESMGK